MKALTVRQPWAHAIVHLGKEVENRTWRPPETIIGEYVAIHAAKRFVDRKDVQIDRDSVTLGAIIGIAKITGVHRRRSSDYGWQLADVRKLPQPIACEGHLGLWELPARDVETIRQCFPDLNL